jgi:hypothetical protein
MNAADIKNTLLSVLPSRPDIVIGDFNFELKELNNSKVQKPQDRIDVFFDFAMQIDVQWIRAANNSRNVRTNARLDHLFGNNELDIEWNYLPTDHLVIGSDHGYMDVVVRNAEAYATRQALPNETRRYFLRKLDNDLTADIFQQYYVENFESEGTSVGHLATMISKFRVEMKTRRFSTNEIFDFINTCDSYLAENVHETAEQILGSYIVNEARLQPDMILTQLNTVKTNVEAQILFKRAQRGKQTPLQASAPGVNIFEEGLQHYRSIWSQENTVIEPPEPPDMSNNVPFGIDMLQKKIKKYPAGRAPGVDDLHISLMKPLIETSFLGDLFQLYALCYESGITPSSWNEAITYLLPKDKDNPRISNTRPISLTRMFRRVFECILQEIWSDKAWAKIHRMQSGCRKGFSTFTQCTLNDYLSKYPEITGDNVRGITVLLDIAKAFDTVRHQDLLAELTKRKSPKRVLSLVYYLFMSNPRTRLVVNGTRTEEIRLTNGIFQGSVLSPFLFMIWIDDLCQELNQEQVGAETRQVMRALFFVDDIALKCVSIVEANLLLQKCESWAIRNSIRFNANKSTVIRPSGWNQNASFLIHGQEIPIKESDKYLGVPTNAKGTIYPELVRRNFEKALATLRFVEARGQQWPEWAKIQIYKSFIDSQFNYMGPGLNSWYRLNQEAKIHLAHLDGPEEQDISIKDASEKLLKRGLRWIFNRSSNNYYPTMRHMTLLLTPIERWDRLATQFYHFQQNLHQDNPITVIRDKFVNFFPLFWGNKNILSRVFQRPPIYKAFLESIQQANEAGTDPPSIQTFLRNKTIEEQRRQHPQNNTLRYVMDKARQGAASKMDACLSIRDEETRKRAILWRLNSLFTSAVCPGFTNEAYCGAQWTRGHLDRCQLLQDFEGITDTHRERYEAEKLRLREEDLELWVATHRADITSHLNYNIIDSLLNNKQWTLFKDFTRHLEAQIDGERFRRLYTVLP